MNNRQIYKALRFLTAIVWIANGLFCKVLNLVPRHQEIVARILGDAYAKPLTMLIGVFEIAMAVWILSGYKTRANAVAQILVVATMNIIEYFIAYDLLLWGKFNSVFAFMFILVIYLNEFHIKPKDLN